MKRTKCRYCNRWIIFARTATGKWMPVDPEPRTDGNVLLEDRGAKTPPVATVDEPAPKRTLFDDPPVHTDWERRTRHRSHMMTCPHAEQARVDKRGRKGKPPKGPR